jgi:hypothetical protein
MIDTANNQGDTLVVLALIVLLPLLLWVYTRRARRAEGFPLRPIPAFRTLQGLLGLAAESGKQVHVSVGSAGIGGAETAAVSAGLVALRHVAEQGAAFRFSPIVTVADPAVMLAAQDILYRAHRRAGLESSYRSTAVQLIAPNPAAYAAGAQAVIDQESVAANVMIGPMGAEFLLIAEPGARREMIQMVGTDSVNLQPLMLATSDRMLVAEEMFAAGAYLSRRPEQIASLQVEDTLRLLVVAGIVIGVLIKTFF